MKLLQWFRKRFGFKGPVAKYRGKQAEEAVANIVVMWGNSDAMTRTDRSHVREVWPQLAWELDVLEANVKIGWKAMKDGR